MSLKLEIGKLGSEALKLLDLGFQFERVDEGTAQERLDTCMGCDKREGEQCGACGCELAFKVQLATNPTKIGFTKTKNSCPIGRW